MKFTLIATLTTLAFAGGVQAQEPTIGRWTASKHPIAVGYAEETGGDRDALVARLNGEIFGKRPADHGMN